MRYFLLLILVVIAIEVRLRRRDGDRARTARDLWTLVLGALALLPLRLWLGAASRDPAIAMVFGQAAIALWMWRAWLSLAFVGFGERAIDRFVRVPALALALAAAAIGLDFAWPLMVIAGWSFRWHRHLGTRARFAAGIGAGLTFGLLLGWVGRDGLPPPAAALAQIAGFVRHVVMYSGLVAFFATLASVPSDTTLGIRSVSRRLGLSHMLVSVVPLLLIGTLWIWTTWLGVGADRAVVAMRAMEATHTALSRRVQGALDSADPERALRHMTDRAPDDERGMRVFLHEAKATRRLAGDPLLFESLMPSFFGAARHLRSGPVLRLPGAAFVWGWAWSDDSTRAALAMVPLATALAGSPAHIAGGGLRAISPRIQPNDFVADSAVTATFGDGQDSGARDSLKRVLARRALLALGLPDSLIQGREGRSRLRIKVSGRTVGDASEGDSLKPMLGFTGQLMPGGVAFDQGRWHDGQTLIRVITPLGDALLGLYRHIRENPVGIVPLLVLELLVAMAIPVLLFNLAIVRGLQRSITSGLGGLRGGFAAIGQGQLAYRVPVSDRPDELADAARAFNQMAADLERGRELQKERDRFESELELARRIQARLLPASPPDVPGWNIAGLSQSAREVGGDYYDHLPLPDGRQLLVIADVSGKGAPAALLMSAFRASLMSQDLGSPDTARLASRLNDFLHRSVESGRFVTAFLAVLDPATGRIDYTNAGHNPPFVVRADGASEQLEAGGLILGIMQGASFEAGTVTLNEGDLVALYTDGVTEGADASGEQWGEERLLESLRRWRAGASGVIAEELVREVRAFEGETGPADDITVLIARRARGN